MKKPIFSHDRPNVLSLAPLAADDILEDIGVHPVRLPIKLWTAKQLRPLFERLDGCVFWGGADLPRSWSLPQMSGASLSEMLQCPDVNTMRDWTEIILCRWALEKDIPVFGVCRGHQLLNVAMGGSLHTHIDHHMGEWHGLDAHGRSEWSQLLSTVPYVNSLHHQAVDTLAPGLRIAATSPDGVIESIESRTHTCAVGVQFHPEMSPTGHTMEDLLPWFCSKVKSTALVAAA